MCFLRENRNSFKGRDSPTNRNTASNARLRGRESAGGVKSKRTSPAQSAGATQLSHSNQRRVGRYYAQRASAVERRTLWLRSEKLTTLEGFFRFYLEQPRMAESPKFAHRSNLDRTMDSICRRCIATVATVYDEGALLRYEQQHICDPGFGCAI